MMICRYCAHFSQLPCRNTRDMEDNAIEGSDPCWLALQRIGGGERGLAYVQINRAKVMSKMQKHFQHELQKERQRRGNIE